MAYVTFEKKHSARTGNILFQYLMCKLISLLYGHTYIPIEEFNTLNLENVNVVHDQNADSFVLDKTKDNIEDNLKTQHIRCDGFFQKSNYYLPHRNQLLTLLHNSKHDYWISYDGSREEIEKFLCRPTDSQCAFQWNSNDIFISLRLDDFIQLPRESSDIIPPQYYLDIIEKEMAQRYDVESSTFPQLYIICDTLRHHWEHKYLEFFNKWSPLRIQQSVIEDCHVMRDCPLLIHSNSTMCWFMSFLSHSDVTQKTRYIPRTRFYASQNLDKIDESDVIQYVNPLLHHEVYNINNHEYLKRYIYPLSYCIPDECIVEDSDVNTKIHEIAPLIPGNRSNYCFDADHEAEYNNMYKESLFAHTMKKGGWDCLRHYEIMANGCIPIFKDLENCPAHTLTSFPKTIVLEASRELVPTESRDSLLYWYNKKEVYETYVKNMLQHVRENCSTSATTQLFLSKMTIKPKNVLLVMGNIGVNYTRETFWIGMKRYIQSIGGVALEYPKIDFLYKNYLGNKSQLYGNGFTYAMRLDDDYTFSNDELIAKVKSHFFDMIIYGKVGPDELHEGSHPNMPLWEHVFKRYTRDEIVFLYGGDECTNVTHNNRYQQHIIQHSQYGSCWVRELIM